MQGELAAQAEWDYAPAPESRDVVSIAPEYGLFIDGEFVPAADGRQFATVNPATEEPLAQVADAGEADIDRAVAAARAAYERVWGPMPGAERAKYLYRIARLLQERSREFAVLESLDNGKPIKESRDVDIPLAAAHFFYHAGWADKLEHAGFGPSPRPLGVAGQVIPWNFPLVMAAWKLAPALAAGNTCVLKPAETTPLTALLLAEVCQQAGLPPGVLNVTTGAGSAGAALVSHPGVDKIAFTGSTEVGKEIQRAVAGTGKRLTLELGGKAANIVFDDAPVEGAIEGIVNGIFFNQGHVCCAGSRLLVQESVADAVLGRLRDRLGTLRLRGPLGQKNTNRAPHPPPAPRPARHVAARRPAGQEHRHRRHQLTPAARQDPRAVRRGGGGRRGALVPAMPAAGPRLLVPADAVHRGQPVTPDRAGRDLRAGALGAHVPDPGRGGRQGQQHPVRPFCRGVDRKGQPDPVDGAAAAGRRGLGQHVQQVRPDQPVRRLPRIRLRAGGRQARPRRVPECLRRSPRPEASTASTYGRPTSRTSDARSRARNRAGLTRSPAPTATCWATPRRRHARTRATR